MNLSNSKRKKTILLLSLGLLVGVLIIVSNLFVAPFLMRLPADFNYSADLLSFDNFYNEEEQAFTGETRSVTTFGYQATESRNGVVNVVNSFNVRTVAGDKIISIDRSYGINPLSWQHVSGFGDSERAGHLFGPRHLRPNGAFTYWHINYNVPIELVYDGTEDIFGLETYRYRVDFSVDQTDDLTHLPGVPEERGVNLDVSLTLWLEPATGWLVKYNDEAIAFYYDRETNVRTNPWNKFRNTYSRASVLEQVAEAEHRKFKLFLFEWLIPLLIGLVLLSFFLFKWGQKKLMLVIVSSGFLLAAVYVGFIFWTPSKQEPIVIGVSRWVPLGNTAYDDNIRGFKDALRLSGYREEDIEYLDRTANTNSKMQEDIAAEFLERNVDLIYSLTTPGSLSLKSSISNRPIVFSVVTYPVETGLIMSLDNSGNNLVGARNWVPISEQIKNFRDIVPTAQKIGFVHRKGEPNSEIQLQEMREEAKLLNIEIVEIAGTDLPELVVALEEALPAVDSLYSACDTLVQGEAERVIIAFALEHKLPSFSCNISGPFNGDLIGTVTDFYEIGKRAGEKAVLILEGASPGSLETNTVSRPLIYINQRTARHLGITIPQNIVAKSENAIK